MNAARLLLSLLMLAFPLVSRAGLEAYGGLIQADHGSEPLARGEVRITYLGTNGYLLEARNAAVLLDPYLTRVGLWKTLCNAPITPDQSQLALLRARLPKRLDAVLVTHGHIDHLLDAVPLAREKRAVLVASLSSVHLAQAAGAARVRAVRPGDRLQIGLLKVDILQATHDRIFGAIPYPGQHPASAPPPRRVADWVCGEPLAFLIEIGGQRIYFDSGGSNRVLPSDALGPVDLAILGTALRDSRHRFAQAVSQLRPRYVLPSHQDNFFRPIARGFTFGPLTDFPSVRRQYSSKRLPGHLILLDYFRPWTLR